MFFLKHWSDMTFSLNDVMYICGIVTSFIILKYRVAALENKLKEIILKQDDFRKVIYKKLEENNQSMHNIEISIEKLRSELLSKIK